jgi:hypothetical protein
MSHHCFGIKPCPGESTISTFFMITPPQLSSTTYYDFLHYTMALSIPISCGAFYFKSHIEIEVTVMEPKKCKTRLKEDNL